MNLAAFAPFKISDPSKNCAKPKVSVCIPNYNYGRFLGDAIDSVLGQTFTHFDLIICDNASTDNTHEVVRRYKDSRIRYRRYRINVPFVYNFNRCLEHVETEMVLVLCADDMLAPDTLELLVNALDSHPSAALAMAQQRKMIDEAGQRDGDVYRLQCGPGLVRGHDVLVSECCQAHIVGMPSQTLARTDVVLAHSGFDPVAGIGCDADLCCRICEHWDAVFVSEAEIYNRRHIGTESRKRCANLEETKARFLFMERLFQNSRILKDNRALKRACVKNRLYSVSFAPFDDMLRGDVRGLVWLIPRMARFEPLPWWLPYFACRYVIRRFGSLLHRLKRAQSRLAKGASTPATE